MSVGVREAGLTNVPRTLIFLTSGTYGDAAQYVALGRAVQAAGDRVVIATHRSFRALVESRNLSFALLDGNPSELMTQPGEQSALTFDGDWLRSLRATVRFWRAARPVYVRLLASAWQACREAKPDAIILGLPTTWGVHIAEALGVPCLWCCSQPLSRTRAFPSALLPTTFSIGPAYNWLTHLLAEQALWQPWRSLINRWRRETLGRPPAPFSGPGAARQVLYGFSPRVVPRPADWPPSHVITGYWFQDEPLGWTPPTELADFLEAGAPPVYIGFGSPGTRRPIETVHLITQALTLSGLRAVLALPGGFPSNVPLPLNVLPISRTPHVWLFPRVAAVVHHGGAGTTGTGLRAGLPTLILPLAVDQFFWGKRVAELGVGPRPIPQRALNAEKLAQALTQAAQDQAMRSRAQILGDALRAEDGAGRAVGIIRMLL
jgi:UDP:flavonoid glycosyltransferase YjiC (YdhE family)